MSYEPIEPDEHLEEGRQGLEFKSFLGTTSGTPAGQNGAQSLGTSNQGYILDQQKSSNILSVDYYQQYFDVDTSTVLRRCVTTLLPFSPRYRSEHLTPSPDLYGPFWTLTTLIFTLYLSSSLAASIAAYFSLSPSSDIHYDFRLLPLSVTLVYAYGLGLPVLLWIVLRWMGVGSNGGDAWSVVEAISVWGYAMFVWIPVSILCVIPVAILRWILVGIGFGFSGWFLAANVYPVLATADAKSLRLLIILIGVLHVGIALTFKVLYFSYYVVRA